MLNATVNVDGVVKALNVCSTNVLNAFKSSTFATKYKNPTRLVAVSKIKPVELLRAVYDQGHRHFGENSATFANMPRAQHVAAKSVIDTEGIATGNGSAVATSTSSGQPSTSPDVNTSTTR